MCPYDISYLLFLYFQVSHQSSLQSAQSHTYLSSSLLLPTTTAIFEMSAQSCPDMVFWSLDVGQKVKRVLNYPRVGGSILPGVKVTRNENFESTLSEKERERKKESERELTELGEKEICQNGFAWCGRCGAAAFGVVPSIPSAIMTAAAAAVKRAKSQWKWYRSLRGGQKRPDLRRVSIRANCGALAWSFQILFKRGQNGQSIFNQGLSTQQCLWGSKSKRVSRQQNTRAK